MLTAEQRSAAVAKGWTEERKEKHRATFNPYLLGGGRPKGSKNKRPYPLAARLYKSEQTKEYLKSHPHAWLGRKHSEEAIIKKRDKMIQYFANGGRIKGWHKGLFHPKHPEKYDGNADNIVYRSGWELNFFRYCDETPGVVKWQSEEFSIPYVSPKDGHSHRYFPDCRLDIRTNTGAIKTLLVEIKPKVQTLPPDAKRRKTKKFLAEAATYAINQAKWRAAEAYCKARGWTFMVMTEDHLFKKK